MSGKKLICLQYAAMGFDAQSIAEETLLTQGSVEQYLATVRCHLAASNISHAVLIASKAGLI